jgi:hypothetical protein
MGLDTYAMLRRPDGEWDVAPDEPFAGLHLVGGMYSGGAGSSSIRGKVYSEVLLEATGESLYQERIEPEKVVEMARLLRAAVEEAKRAGARSGRREIGELDERGGFRTVTKKIPVLDVAGEEIEAKEAEDLARWFEVCAKHGYAVAGWY